MRLHDWLMRLYPSGFRAEYGGEMRAIFTRRRRAAATPWEVAALWAATLWDTLTNAARIHADILRQDLRYTARSLGRAPGFTLTVMVVSALGIGATTAAFSLADHVLLRPLPFKDPDALVRLWQDQRSRGYAMMELSPAVYRDWKGASRSFSAMGVYWTVSMNLVGPGTPERLDGASVTPEVLTLLGARASLGRTFAPSDDDPSAGRSVILSDGLWRAMFNADRTVVGRTIMLDGDPHAVVGVMPADFHFPSREAEFWTVLRFEPPDFLDRSNTYLQAVARLEPGVTLDEARAEMQVITARLEREHPVVNYRSGATLVLMKDQVSERSRNLLLAIAGASLCVLLIACTNLANLLLARALTRQKELAVRTAIGAGPERLVRQMLTESLLLAVVGGVAGVAIAVAAGPLLVRLVPTTLPIAEVPPLDGRVLALAAVVTLATGIGFGMAPAWRARRNDAILGLRDGSRAGTGTATRRLRGALVVTEVAASVLLLIAAGLLIRALARVQQTDPGFRTDGAVTLRTWLPYPKYEQTGRREAFYRDVLSGVRALPGVRHAGYISFLPMSSMRGGIWPVTPEGSPADAVDAPVASLRYVTTGAFDALGMTIRRGRDVADSDTQTSPFVAVVSESFARRHWPGSDPLGRRFTIAFFPRTVVGVVNDISVRGLERTSEPQVYLPSAQVPDGWMPLYPPKDLAISAAAPISALVPAVRAIVAKADPQQAISDVQTLEEIVAADSAPRRAQVRVLGGFALVAFLLAAIGIHSLLSFTVSAQRRDIGVRRALGAGVWRIVWMVMRRTALLAGAGIAAGAVAGYLAGRALQSLLVGVSPADALTFGAATLLAVAMALAGSAIPAARAARVDPLIAMRQEG